MEYSFAVIVCDNAHRPLKVAFTITEAEAEQMFDAFRDNLATNETVFFARITKGESVQ